MPRVVDFKSKDVKALREYCGRHDVDGYSRDMNTKTKLLALIRKHIKAQKDESPKKKKVAPKRETAVSSKRGESRILAQLIKGGKVKTRNPVSEMTEKQIHNALLRYRLKSGEDPFAKKVSEKKKAGAKKAKKVNKDEEMAVGAKKRLQSVSAIAQKHDEDIRGVMGRILSDIHYVKSGKKVVLTGTMKRDALTKIVTFKMADRKQNQTIRMHAGKTADTVAITQGKEHEEVTKPQWVAKLYPLLLRIQRATTLLRMVAFKKKQEKKKQVEDEEPKAKKAAKPKKKEKKPEKEKPEKKKPAKKAPKKKKGDDDGGDDVEEQKGGKKKVKDDKKKELKVHEIKNDPPKDNKNITWSELAKVNERTKEEDISENHSTSAFMALSKFTKALSMFGIIGLKEEENVSFSDAKFTGYMPLRIYLSMFKNSSELLKALKEEPDLLDKYIDVHVTFDDEDNVEFLWDITMDMLGFPDVAFDDYKETWTKRTQHLGTYFMELCLYHESFKDKFLALWKRHLSSAKPSKHQFMKNYLKTKKHEKAVNNRSSDSEKEDEKKDGPKLEQTPPPIDPASTAAAKKNGFFKKDDSKPKKKISIDELLSKYPGIPVPDSAAASSGVPPGFVPNY